MKKKPRNNELLSQKLRLREFSGGKEQAAIYGHVRRRLMDLGGGMGKIDQRQLMMLDMMVMPKMMIIWNVNQYLMRLGTIVDEEEKRLLPIVMDYLKFSESLRRDLETYGAVCKTIKDMKELESSDDLEKYLYKKKAREYHHKEGIDRMADRRKSVKERAEKLMGVFGQEGGGEEESGGGNVF